MRGRAWYLAHRGRRINIGSRREGWRSKKGRWVVREKKEENERKREKERQRKKKKVERKGKRRTTLPLTHIYSRRHLGQDPAGM